MPIPGALQATLLIDGGSPAWGQRLGAALHAGEPVIELRPADRRLPAVARDESPAADCPVHYLGFSVDEEAAALLADARTAVLLALNHPGETFTVPLPPETRTDLADDLAGFGRPPQSSLLARLGTGGVRRSAQALLSL